jgi:hypothetical protein
MARFVDGINAMGHDTDSGQVETNARDGDGRLT